MEPETVTQVQHRNGPQRSLPARRVKGFVMLHIFSTMIFLGSGAFSLAVIAAMLIDNAPVVKRALGLRVAVPALPGRTSRVRVLRSPRLAPMSPVRTRAAA